MIDGVRTGGMESGPGAVPAGVTAGMVKDLRGRTGAGMMDCKAALVETGGVMDDAVDWLRTRGLAKAVKKAGRTAREGLVAVAVNGARGALVEVSAETDFAARSAQFQDLVRSIAALAPDAGGSLERLLEMPLPGGAPVGRHVAEMAGVIGERMAVRRTAVLDAPGTVASYVHARVAENMGRIGVLVGLRGSASPDLGRQIAMHVAAAQPLAVCATDLDPRVLARERAVLTAQAEESGKPAAVAEKMVAGRMRKFLKDNVLLTQAFIVDGERTVAEVLKAGDAEVTGFACFILGGDAGEENAGGRDTADA